MPVETSRRSSTVSEPKRHAAEQVTSTLTRSAHAPAELDWQAFSAAYFPERGRHDLEALTAYGAYRRTRAGGTLSSDEPVRLEAGRRATGARPFRNWEGEGGATLSADGS